MRCEHGERLARTACGGCDDAVESQLVRRAPDLLAGVVVADWRSEIGSGEACAAQRRRVAQVEYAAETYPARDEIPGTDHGSRQPAVEIDIDEMSVCLDHHRVRRPSQVEDLELATGSPSSARRRAGQRANPRGWFTLGFAQAPSIWSLLHELTPRQTAKSRKMLHLERQISYALDAKFSTLSDIIPDMRRWRQRLVRPVANRPEGEVQ